MPLQGKEKLEITTLLTRELGKSSLTGTLQEESDAEVLFPSRKK